MTTIETNSTGRSNILFAFILSVLFTGLFSPGALAQSSEEAAIKALIEAETQALIDRDTEAWQSFWLHDSSASRTIVSSNQIKEWKGWENFGPDIIQFLKENPHTETVKIINSNYSIYTYGDMALVHNDQLDIFPDAPQKKGGLWKRQRALVKQDGQWKILSSTGYEMETFGSSPEAIEGSLNTIGYNLMDDKKLKEAIEVFKFNVQMHPDTWNTYDSLGEAYAEAGDKKKAIKMYEKSIQLNPNNVGGKKALEKLRQKELASTK